MARPGRDETISPGGIQYLVAIQRSSTIFGIATKLTFQGCFFSRLSALCGTIKTQRRGVGEHEIYDDSCRPEYPGIWNGACRGKVLRAPYELEPREAMHAKLVRDGWRIISIKPADGCYDVIATDEKGVLVDAYFDPKNSTRLKLSYKIEGCLVCSLTWERTLAPLIADISWRIYL